MSTPANPIDVYLVQLEFSQLSTEKDSRFFDAIPASFTLADEQVDRLIDAGHQLLLNNSEFRRLETDLKINAAQSRK